MACLDAEEYNGERNSMSESDPTPETDIDESVTAEGGSDELPENKVNVEDSGTLKKKITVTVPRERIDAKMDEMFGELSTSAQVPGFRVGRAPRRLLEKRFGKDVREDVRNALIGESIGTAIEQADLTTMGEPDMNLDEVELPDSGEMSFDFEVEIQPEFDLPKTEGIEVNRDIFEVDSDRVDEYIDNIREGQARYEKTDEPTEEGDAIVARATITGEGIEHEVPQANLRIAASMLEGIPLPDLGETLKGKTTGDEVTISKTVSDSHSNEDWQGKDVEIQLEITEVNRRIIPELNDAFAEQSGFDSVEELREFVASRLKARVDTEIQRSLRDQVCAYLIENTQFDLPAGVVSRHTQRLVQRRFVELLQRGVPRERIEENLAELQAAAEEEATANLKLSFILGKIADEEDIEVSDAEINSRVAQMAAQYGRRPERLRQELTADGSLEQVAISIREEKALDKLLEDARITEVKPEDKADETEEGDGTVEKASTGTSAKKSASKSEKDDETDDGDETAAKKATKKAKKTSTKKKSTKKDET
ncbi:MAG: trigger factor [Phycisphaerae bacterium]|nr:trigger factor [Phycisphaerae bacterium]